MSQIETGVAPSATPTWEQLQDRQLEMFRDLQSRLGEHDVWRERIGHLAPIAGYESLLDVPFTTKHDLRGGQVEPDQARPLGAFQLVPTEQLVQITSSSGTTGAPTYFGVTANDLDRWRVGIGNAYATAGVEPGTIVALTTGMAIVAGGMPYADGIRSAGGALAWIGGQTTARMAMAMQRLRVSVLVATASFATHFANRCEELLGVPAPELAVRTIIAGGEPGAGVPHIRQGILDAWGATRVSEFMGLGDVLPALWAECEAGNGMHFTAAPDVLVELIDPETQEHIPWEPGATGEAVYTTLTREACPVVRFRSGDQLLITGVECACGRRTPTVRCVGRTDDMLIYKAMNVYPSSIREVVLDVASDVLSGTMRIRKDTKEQVRFDVPLPLEVELQEGLDPAAAEVPLRAAADAVSERLRVRVAIEPRVHGEIPISDYKNALTYVEGTNPYA
ncbi:MAG: phenylacetate--CoA ligase family protein [Pseudoclavibacter sp.]